MAAREKARLVQCTNNQSELGKAIMMYETEKGHLPAVVSRVSETNINSQQKTWVMEVFEGMGRGDLMNEYRGGVGKYVANAPDATQGGCNPSLVYVEQLVCPSNKQAATPGGLSYIVNMGVYRLNTATPPAMDLTVRLFRNRACVGAAGNEPHFGFVSLKTPTRTVMLSESLTAGPWTLPYSTTPPLLPPIASGLPLADFSHWAFAWPQPPAAMATVTPTIGDTLNGPGLSSNHGGRIVVTFCDGHSETLSELSKCWKQPGDPEEMPQLYGWPQ
jgi:prepilin-type processing-associated H-X9-DG protein